MSDIVENMSIDSGIRAIIKKKDANYGFDASFAPKNENERVDFIGLDKILKEY